MDDAAIASRLFPACTAHAEHRRTGNLSECLNCGRRWMREADFADQAIGWFWGAMGVVMALVVLALVIGVATGQ
jgi:hypothetical protein